MRLYWGILLISLGLSSCGDSTAEQTTTETTNSVAEKNVIHPTFAYGFNLSEFNVITDTIRSGDSFGELMLENKVDYPKIHALTERFKDTFDVRRIRAGKPYMILKSKDTSEIGQVFIYEQDAINYTVVDFRDSVVAYNKKRQVTFVQKEASGIIPDGGSLSNVIVEQGLDYYLTYDLSQIYAWTIDFFKLNPGDKFKIIYQEKYINDSIYAGVGPIEAAYFEHNGQSFYAFSYENDSLGVREYYDEEANNLRRTFLRAPLQFGRLSSRYNLKRKIRYYGYKVRPHKGTDYAAPIGTPILATADGVVTESTRRGGNGKYVKIRHNGTYSTQYLHMKAQKVKQGEFVKQGDVIGWIGMTGNTGGPHVCYRFWKNGRQVDPLREDLPVAEPLAEELRTAYFDYTNPLKDQLECIEYTPSESMEDLVTLNE
jgi:murein DD-endopeptidase MepM/ murein hydrolase activator NlpD